MCRISAGEHVGVPARPLLVARLEEGGVAEPAAMAGTDAVEVPGFGNRPVSSLRSREAPWSSLDVPGPVARRLESGSEAPTLHADGVLVSEAREAREVGEREDDLSRSGPLVCASFPLRVSAGQTKG